MGYFSDEARMIVYQGTTKVRWRILFGVVCFLIWSWIPVDLWLLKLAIDIGIFIGVFMLLGWIAMKSKPIDKSADLPSDTKRRHG